MIHVVALAHPEMVNQTHCLSPEGSEPVAEIDDVTSPLPKRKVPPNCCWHKSSWMLWLAMAQRGFWEWNHSYNLPAGGIFSVEVAFATTKDIHLELGLEGPEVLYLGVVVNIKRKSSDIAKKIFGYVH